MLLSAFILGLAGSLHCAGMCSPLAFAVTNMSRAVWLNRFVYNAGRIFTYSILGALVSTIGVALPIEKFQMGLSVGMGLMLIAVAFLGIGQVKFKIIARIVNRLTGWLKELFSSQVRRKTTVSNFLLGMLNGLLPCGLTFIALTSCLIFPSVQDGFYFMIMFGLGTFPVMIGFASIFQLGIQKFRISIVKLNMIMLILAGSLLIGRAFLDHSAPNAVVSNEATICR